MTHDNDKWFSPAELAGQPGESGGPRGRRAWAKWLTKNAAHRGRARMGRGGGIEYSLECLPAATQLALSRTAVPEAPAADRDQNPGEALSREFELKPASAREKARRALGIVQEFHRLKDELGSRRAALEAVTRAHGIAERTLGNYLALVRGEAEHLWLYLLAPRPAGRRPEAPMSAEAWEVLKADYLRRSQPTASGCVQRLLEASAGKGWQLPSARTMQRRLEQLPRAMKLMAREGRDAVMKLYPAQKRVRDALHALYAVNADGYAHKRLWIAFEDGEVRRAKTVFWQDVYSSKILAWRTDKTEHTELYRLSFGDLVERYGIPAKVVLLDNTTAAANKTMSGGVPYRYRFKVKPEDPDGVFKLMGIQRVIWATPGHGQAKPIERVFGTGGIGEYVDKAPEFEGAGDDEKSYNGKKRPIPIAQLEAVIAREVAALNARTGRRSPLHQSRSFDEVFAESYKQITVKRATEHQRRLWLLCTEPVKVRSDATITLDAGRKVGEHAANSYYSSALQDHIGQYVAARFDPRLLHEGVHVYTVDGKPIDYAECIDPKGFDDQNAGREHARDRGAMLRAERAYLTAERRMTAREAGATLADARAGIAASSSIPAPKLVQRDFRHPLGRQRHIPLERTKEEQAELERIARQAATPRSENVMAMPSDAARHDYWQKLDKRRAAGETLPEGDEKFWHHWQTEAYFCDAAERERLFYEAIGKRREQANG